MVWPTQFDVKLDYYDAMELPGQQLGASHAATHLDHALNLNINAPAGCQRLTGIIAAIGKTSMNIDTMVHMMAAGMNIAMINMSYETREEHLDTIRMLRQAAKEYSTKINKNYPLGIAALLTRRKIKTGRIADTFGNYVTLKEGDVVRLTTDETYRERCSASTIFVDFYKLGEQLKKGNIICLDHEMIVLKVEIISSTTFTCIVQRGGQLGSWKDVFISNNIFNMPAFSEKDMLDIEMLIQHQIDIIIAPFVNSSSVLTELRSIMGEKGKKVAIVAKVQNSSGYDNFDDILSAADGIMLSRQELGSDITPEKLVIAQKNMIARANKANVPISVCAELLSSMREKKVPLRAELLDVANCVIDGADALVLSAETSIGKYPAEVVACTAKICKEAESCLWSKQFFLDMVDKTPMPCDHATATALSAVLAAQRVLAAAIISLTSTGHSVAFIARYRPRCPIVAVTRYQYLAKQLHLWRGIIPFIYEDIPDPEWAIDLVNRVNSAVRWSLDEGFVRIGDPLVVVSGWKQGPGNTNTIRVVYASPDTQVL